MNKVLLSVMFAASALTVSATTTTDNLSGIFADGATWGDEFKYTGQALVTNKVGDEWILQDESGAAMVYAVKGIYMGEQEIAVGDYITNFEVAIDDVDTRYLVHVNEGRWDSPISCVIISSGNEVESKDYDLTDSNYPIYQYVKVSGKLTSEDGYYGATYTLTAGDNSLTFMMIDSSFDLTEYVDKDIVAEGHIIPQWNGTAFKANTITVDETPVTPEDPVYNTLASLFSDDVKDGDEMVYTGQALVTGNIFGQWMIQDESGAALLYAGQSVYMGDQEIAIGDYITKVEISIESKSDQIITHVSENAWTSPVSCVIISSGNEVVAEDFSLATEVYPIYRFVKIAGKVSAVEDTYYGTTYTLTEGENSVSLSMIDYEKDLSPYADADVIAHGYLMSQWGGGYIFYVDTIAIDSSSVAVATATAEKEYFTIDGLKVTAPQEGHLYIVRSNGKITKEIYR